MLGSVFHGYVSLEMDGGFSHTGVDSQEPWTWTWTLDFIDALLRNRPLP